MFLFITLHTLLLTLFTQRATASATIQPASVSGGSTVTSTVTFIVPTGGLSTGDAVAVDLPANWNSYLQTTCPACNGYVSLTSTGAVTFSALNVSTTGVTVSLQGGTLTQGLQLQFLFQSINSGCPFSGQTVALWKVRTTPSGSTAFQTSIATQAYTTGIAQWIGFGTNNGITTVANQPSSALILQPFNSCGQVVQVSSAVTISLSGQAQNSVNYSYATDAGAQFSATANFGTTVTSVTIPALGTAATFYYETSSVGNMAIQGSYASFVFAGSQQTWLYVNSLAALPGFTHVSIDNGALVTGQTAVAITPDGTGVTNFAYIHFLPSTNTQQWHVAISSNNFQTTVFDQWGSGDPQSNVGWNGQLQPNGGANAASQVAPDGTYTVKIEFPGLSANTSLLVTVHTSQIQGTVLLSGTPVSGARVSAQGPGVYNSVYTDASGNYAINGLHAGNSYNLFANYTNPVNQAVVTGQIPNVAAPASGKNFSLSTPLVIRVAAVAPAPASAVVYANLNLHASDYSQNYFGNLRLQSNATTTDNGDNFSPSTWTVFYAQPGTTYTLHLTMPGYGASDISVSASSDVIIALTREANVYGWIILPSTGTYPQWVSVSGTPAGANTATVWGGAYFNIGQSSAVYNLYAVPPGTYNLEAQASGFVPAVLPNVVVGSADLGTASGGGVDFSTMSVGGTISGTVTINGDTSSQTSPITLFLNAYSPQLGYSVFSQVQIATSATQTSASYQIGGIANGAYQMVSPYLQGFDPSTFGAQNVVVSGGAGSANFTLTQETGQILGTVILPNGQTDYNHVHLVLQGPGINLNQTLSGNTLTLSHLGTGFFSLTAIYKTTGAQFQTTVNLTNGQTASVVFDLSAPTYAISGVVSVQSAFSMKGSTVTQVTINTITDLLANATSQILYLSGTSINGNSGANCSNTSPVSTSTARVEAFPKTFNSYGNSNRNGLSNCFALGSYAFGAINSDGSFTIPNLSPGVWQVDVYPYFDNGQTPDAAAQTQFITVTNANVGAINFLLSAGNGVSGAVNLPSGVIDNRFFNVQILDTQGNTIQTASLQLGVVGTPAASTNFAFSNLPPGQYSLLIQDPGSYDSTLNQNVIKYVAAPVQFKINGADVTGLNVAMVRAARIVGTLGIQTTATGGSTSLTLITTKNSTLLPSGFQISAQADPWVAGGFESAQFSTDGTNRPAIDSNNHFLIDGLAAGTYNVIFQQNTYGVSVQAAGSINLASYTQGSISITPGQTLDIGTIVLKPGLSLAGTVTDTSGHALSNIVVRATPAGNNHGDNSQQVTTDAQGNFTLLGLSPDLKIYDIVAAPRPGTNDVTPPSPYGQVIRRAVDVTKVPAPTLAFSLSPATAQFTGRIITADGGSLSFPESDRAGYPVAAVYLHLEGSTSDDNPLGQENATSLNGAFAIGNLVPGVYDLTVESLGYEPYHVTGLVLADASVKNVGTITLQKGAELDATLARPDGSLVNTNQIDTVVAVSPDLSSIIFGQVNKDANTGNILSLKFSGFLTSPQTYNVLLFDKQNNITAPSEGANLVFVSSADVLTRALTYVPSPPFAFTDIKRAGGIGNPVSITYYFSRPLRNRGDDQTPAQWFTFTGARGSLSGYQISGDRTQLTVFYTPAAGEQNARIAFSAHTVDVNPTTGVEYVLAKTITLLLGQKATVESNINPVLGGTLSLAQSEDPTSVFIPANAFLTSTGSVVNATVSYNFTLSSTDDLASIASGTSSKTFTRSAAYASLINYGAPAYVSEAYQAMNVASRDSTINPLSSFYSILLPAGLSHSLNQTAYITLNYDSAADPSQINIYYFSGDKYYLQNASRTIDPVNHTITVGVNHFSTFVVLQNSAPIVTINGGASNTPDITVFNFPNPFDLTTKTETLANGGDTTSLVTDGTVIHYAIPGAKAGAAHIEIYNVVGEKVRSIDLGLPATDVAHYVAWDGKNDAGRKVASGVYIGILKVGGDKKFWKMAVIK